MSLADLHRSLGADLAPDGIPRHYGDLKAEYHAALERAVLMERSHENRLEMRGQDRFDLLQRMSTNHVLGMALNEGRPTIFTNPNGRMIDRVMVYNREETALLITEPGRGAPLRAYLQRNIFFKDDVQLNDVTPVTSLFVLHGPQADTVMHTLAPVAMAVRDFNGAEITIAGVPVFAARRKPMSGLHWTLVVPVEQAETVWKTIWTQGEPLGLGLAGSLTYNTLRIRAGQPGVSRELSSDYIPLEAGLWDEVSFNKGCYTGQEIIARMESRNRLAKTLVKLRLDVFVEAPAALTQENKPAGTLTSSVTTPDGEHLGLGFVKLTLAVPGQTLIVGDQIIATITALAGVQPPNLPDAKS